MAEVLFEIKTYSVQLTWKIDVLKCYGDDHLLTVFFPHRLDEALWLPYYDTRTKAGTMNVWKNPESLAFYVDLLRNEKPIYAHLNSEEPWFNSISTSKEPVGEEERQLIVLLSDPRPDVDRGPLGPGG